MDEIINELNSVYKMISSLVVSGDNVDLVAASRSKLRKIATSIQELARKDLEKPEDHTVEEV